MNNDQHIRPLITVLNEQQISQIHESSRRIFAKAGAEVDGSRVHIPTDLVQWALDAAPSSVDIHDRRGNFAFRIGNGAETRLRQPSTTRIH